MSEPPFTMPDAVTPVGVCVLGATGSIGASTLDVVSRHPERFRIQVLTANDRVDALFDLCVQHRPSLAVVANPLLQGQLRQRLDQAGLPHIQVLGGAEGLVQAAQWPDAQVVVAAIVGAAGLPATLAAARAGKRILLANKEAIVCAGSLLMAAVQQGGAQLLPVDSEHNAIHQCLEGATERQGVRRLILTASGGPFRLRQDFSDITPEQACAHPNWVMGRKISVDSATLMNKGLEVIEASALFAMPPSLIDVVVHPQSVIHSMVEFGDGSVLAQMGTPDMRTPIAHCLGYPSRIESGSARLDFFGLGALTFEKPDLNRFPCLRLAYQALEAGQAASIVLNAANEIAVQAFLDRQLAFVGIAQLIETCLGAVVADNPGSVDDILDLDARARQHARTLIGQTDSFSCSVTSACRS
jgi:1-deoxy-D-xylulose-5-phosphate reductoisomerase